MNFTGDEDVTYRDENEKSELCESYLPKTGRSSILKPPKVRGPLQDVNLISNNVSVDIDIRKKRVSFAGVNKVREFNSKAGTFHVSNTPSYDEIFSTSSDSSEMSLSESCRNKTRDAITEDEAKAIIDAMSNDDSSNEMDLTDCNENDSFSRKADANSSRREENFDIDSDSENSPDVGISRNKCSEVNNPVGKNNFNPFASNLITSNQNNDDNLIHKVEEKSILGTSKNPDFNNFPLDPKNVILESKYPEIEQIRNAFLFDDDNYGVLPPKNLNNPNVSEMDITQNVRPDKPSSHSIADMSLESNAPPLKVVVNSNHFGNFKETFYSNLTNNDNMSITESINPDKIFRCAASTSIKSNLERQNIALHSNNCAFQQFPPSDLPNSHLENDMDITLNATSDKLPDSVKDISLGFKLMQTPPINFRQTNEIGNLNVCQNRERSGINDCEEECGKSKSLDTDPLKHFAEMNAVNSKIVKVTPDASVGDGVLNVETKFSVHPEFNISNDMEFTEAVHMVVKSSENNSFEGKNNFPLKLTNLNDSSEMEITEACGLGHADKSLFNHEIFKHLRSGKISTKASDLKTLDKSNLHLSSDLQNNEYLGGGNSKVQTNEIYPAIKKVFPDLNAKRDSFKDTSSNMEFTEVLAAKPLENNADRIEDSVDMEFTEACFKNAEFLKSSVRENSSNMEFTNVFHPKAALMKEHCMNISSNNFSTEMEFTEAIIAPVKSKSNDQLSILPRGINYHPDKSDSKCIDGDQFKIFPSRISLATNELNHSTRYNNDLAKDSQIKEHSSNMELTEAFRINYADKNENNANCTEHNREYSPNLETYLFKQFEEMAHIPSNKGFDNKDQLNMDFTEIKSSIDKTFSPEKVPGSIISIIKERDREKSPNMELTEAYGIKYPEETRNNFYLDNSSNMELTEGCYIKLKGDNQNLTRQKLDISAESAVNNSKNEKMEIDASLMKGVNKSDSVFKDIVNKDKCHNQEIPESESVKCNRESTTNLSICNNSVTDFPIQKGIVVNVDDGKERNNQSKSLINEPKVSANLDNDDMELTTAIVDVHVEKLSVQDKYDNHATVDEHFNESVDSGSMDLTQCCSKISFAGDENTSKNQFSVFVDDQEEEVNDPKICKNTSEEVTMNLLSSELNKNEEMDKTFHMEAINPNNLVNVENNEGLEINSELNKVSDKVNDIYLHNSADINNSKIQDGSSHFESCDVPCIENISSSSNIAAIRKDNFTPEKCESIQKQIEAMELKDQNSYQSPAAFMISENKSNPILQQSNTNFDENKLKEKELCLKDNATENCTSFNTSEAIANSIPLETENMTKISDEERIIQSCNELTINVDGEINSESLSSSYNNMKIPKNDSINRNSLIPSKIPKFISKSKTKSKDSFNSAISNCSVEETNRQYNLSFEKQNSNVQSELKASLNKIKPNIINVVESHVQSKSSSRRNSPSIPIYQDSFHCGTESLISDITKAKEVEASNIFTTPQKTNTQDLEHRRHLEEYHCNVQNLKFMKSLSFERISFTEWRYNITKCLCIIIEVPRGEINEGTNLNVVHYKQNINRLSEPLDLYIAGSIKARYPEDLLKSKCQTVRDVSSAAAIITRNRPEIKKFYTAVFHLLRFYPCKLIDNKISFQIVNIKTLHKFDVFISIHGWKKITSNDIKVINHVGTVSESFVRAMFDSILDDKKRLLNFVRYLEDYCPTY